jgi:sulfite reductase alpha subunit-like flavoprotein
VQCNLYIQSQGGQIWNLLSAKGATMYVCGDVSVGARVRDALTRVAKEHGKLSIFLANVCSKQPFIVNSLILL